MYVGPPWPASVVLFSDTRRLVVVRCSLCLQQPGCHQLAVCTGRLLSLEFTLLRVCTGTRLQARGPLGGLTYLGRRGYIHQGKRGHMQRANMVAGGTGITPVFQIIQVQWVQHVDLRDFSIHWCLKFMAVLARGSFFVSAPDRSGPSVVCPCFTVIRDLNT